MRENGIDWSALADDPQILLWNWIATLFFGLTSSGFAEYPEVRPALRFKFV